MSEIELPPPLRAFLSSTAAYACLIHASSIGAMIVAKLPGHEIEAIRGRVPVSVTYELHRHANGPVIRVVLAIHDSLETPLQLETFINPDDSEQLADFTDLVAQDRLRVVCYDEHLAHRLTKRVAQMPDPEREAIIQQAVRMLMETRPDMVNFDRAKADVMRRNPL